MKHVTIIIPTFNEEKVVVQLLKRLHAMADSTKNVKFEFLFVNDGSTDDTLHIIKRLKKDDNRIGYVDLSRNFGKEIAIIAGLDHSNLDAAIIMDADLQDPPELIPKMIDLWLEGYNDVYAKRRVRHGESWLKKLTSKLFYIVLQQLDSIPIQRDTGDFRLLDKRCICALREFRENQRYTKGMYSWIGFRKKEILYDRDPRAAGKTKWNYMKLTNLALEGITSSTTAPLRYSSLLGIVVSLFAFVYILVIILKSIIYGIDVAGYPSLMAVMLFLGGLQLLSLGIIGEYIARIFNETKHRPLYLIQEYRSSNDKN